MSKKRKEQKITKASIRQKGFCDGYQEEKNKGEKYVPKLIKQGIGKQQIIEMILEYNIGYKVGVLSRTDLKGIKIQDNKEYYNGRAISDTVYVNQEEISKQYELRKPNKRR